MKGHVYLLNAWPTNRYKIGFTKNSVKKRIKQLQTGNPDEITQIQVYDTINYKKVEKWMQRLHRAKKVEGEWFELTDEDILSFLDECKKADDTITLLINENHFYK